MTELTETEKTLAEALVKTLPAARQDPYIMRVWMAAHAVHRNYGHPSIEGMQAYTGDLTAKELRKARAQLNKEDITDKGTKN